MILLDTFCGAGGAAMGYHRAGFEVVGVDIKPQPHYPFEFHQADALDFIADHGHEFDVIHASPPCQRYSYETPIEYRERHPDLILPTRKALQATSKPYIIENVPGARKKLIRPVMLCGSMFGLNIWRHRYFETSPLVSILTPCCDHSFVPVLITGTPRRKGYPRKDPPVAIRRKAIDIDWMTTTDLDQAIPPAYTEWIGEQLIYAIRNSQLEAPNDR